MRYRRPDEITSAAEELASNRHLLGRYNIFSRNCQSFVYGCTVGNDSLLTDAPPISSRIGFAIGNILMFPLGILNALTLPHYIWWRSKKNRVKEVSVSVNIKEYFLHLIRFLSENRCNKNQIFFPKFEKLNFLKIQ